VFGIRGRVAIAALFQGRRAFLNLISNNLSIIEKGLNGAVKPRRYGPPHSISMPP
jgi:hypothetical protein